MKCFYPGERKLQYASSESAGIKLVLSCLPGPAQLPPKRKRRSGLCVNAAAMGFLKQHPLGEEEPHCILLSDSLLISELVPQSQQLPKQER